MRFVILFIMLILLNDILSIAMCSANYLALHILPIEIEPELHNLPQSLKLVMYRKKVENICNPVSSGGLQPLFI